MSAASNQLQIVIWNVEHGSALYARTPNGRSIVMDAGASQSFSPATWLNQQYHLSQVELFILSHADCDHITDIEQVDNLLHPCSFERNKTSPRHLIYPTYPPPTNPLKYFERFDNRYSEPLHPGSPLLWIPENWGGVRIVAFCNEYPKYQFAKLNDYSVATFLLYGNLEFLFPGDLEAQGWQALMEREHFIKLSTPSRTNSAEVRFLVAAHHGHVAGMYKPFLDLYRPHLTIISGKYGDQHTDNHSYYTVSTGFPVYNSTTGRTEVRYTVSTKVNNSILVIANTDAVAVSV